MATSIQKESKELCDRIAQNILKLGKANGHNTVGKITNFCGLKPNTLESKLKSPIGFRVEELFAISRAYHVTIAELTKEG